LALEGEGRKHGDIQSILEGCEMRVRAILLALIACSCSESHQPEQRYGAEAVPEAAPSLRDIRGSFLGMIGNDPWANWPTGLLEDPQGQARSCFHVTEAMRQSAINMLEAQPAVRLDEAQHARLVGTVRPPGGGAPYLLRAFSSANSLTRLKWSGDAVVVHTDAAGGLFEVRRNPCVAILNRMPSEVFTVAAYDL
jgi:hypothetical protein